MTFNESDPTLMDSNGQKYLVGWDDYGWFTIQMVEAHPETGEYEPIGEFASTSFPPGVAEDLIPIIEGKD